MDQVIDAQVNAKANGKTTGAAVTVRRLKRKYPDLSNAEIARKAGCSPANACRVLQRFMSAGQDSQVVEEYRQAEAQAIDAKRMKILESIDDAKIAKSSAYQLTGMFALLFDKSQLIRGNATSIEVHYLLDAVEVIREMRDSNR